MLARRIRTDERVLRALSRARRVYADLLRNLGKDFVLHGFNLLWITLRLCEAILKSKCVGVGGAHQKSSRGPVVRCVCAVCVACASRMCCVCLCVCVCVYECV